MSKSDKNPERDIQERADSFIAEYQSQYSEAIDAARQAAVTTETPAWQSRYGDNMKEHKRVVTDHMKEIKQACEAIRTEDTNEGLEEDIKDAVKGITEERIRHQSWWTRAVMGYQNTAERCQSLISKVVNDAREAEQRAPLVDRGLAEEIRKRVQKWPTAQWDEDGGIVVVKEPKTEANEETA